MEARFREGRLVRREFSFANFSFRKEKWKEVHFPKEMDLWDFAQALRLRQS